MDRYTPKRPNYMTGDKEIPAKMQMPVQPQHKVGINPTIARDGFDNSGTQGYDSLSDDGFTGNSIEKNSEN